MKMTNKLSDEEISIISKRYIHGYDKHYRMWAGISSELISYNNFIISLEINNTEKRKPSNFDTAKWSAINWASFIPELRNALGFVVTFKKSASTGFVIGVNEVNNKTLVEQLIADLKKPQEEKLIAIYSGLLTKQEIDLYYKEHSSQTK
jgi:hypothetical protein